MAVKIHLPSESENARIEMLPLIDVVFCILTFFILAAVSLTRQQAITLNLPQASTSQAQSQKMLVVSIDPAGQLFVDKDPVNRSELYERLATYLKTNPQGMVILRASQVVSYNEVIQVLDLLRSLGGNRVALATQPVEQPVLSTQTRPNPLPSPPANDQPIPSKP
ncbi:MULTISPECIES: biopolymer transporter ExbD [unclassified Thermosynechococcus]|uniref:ExbD/TolR family protein n=1 Tax=unclassified Thermosynechococcus TaxID=2622553 RepID=UPI002872B53B|nr:MULTISPECIES: biopolymer transporter ExbD [unclassified Thermosynechococcus]WNC31193.1 biopolymer transporter ExbD [Thermosynechococcus sp. PKX82]WNC61586.1 biopolymer transporter ExbD [Thermosynechococcus sp. QS41]